MSINSSQYQWNVGCLAQHLKRPNTHFAVPNRPWSSKTRRNGMNLQHHRKSFSNESSSFVGPESQYLAGMSVSRCVRFNRHHVLPSRTQKVRKSLSSGKALTKQHLMNGCDAQIFQLVVCWVTRRGIRVEVHLNFRKMIKFRYALTSKSLLFRNLPWNPNCVPKSSNPKIRKFFFSPAVDRKEQPMLLLHLPYRTQIFARGNIFDKTAKPSSSTSVVVVPSTRLPLHTGRSLVEARRSFRFAIIRGFGK